MKKEIVIPFQPHEYQQEIIENLKRFNCVIAHRRFGKTTLAVNLLVRDALASTHPFYLGCYVAPTYRMSKNVAWKYLKYYMEPIPGVKFHETDLRAILPNGSQIILLGSEDPDKIRGLGINFCVIDEVSLMAPRTWSEVLRPALADRLGSAFFIGTPAGKNLLFKVYTTAEEDDTDLWYSASYKASETGLLPNFELESIAKDLSPEEYDQEMECSFTAAIRGAYYAKILSRLEDDGKIGDVPWIPNKPVFTAWDIGVNDATSIIFYQKDGPNINIIDFYEDNNEGLEFYAKYLQRLPYTYAVHYGPHDLKAREFGTGKSRIETAKSLGLRFKVVKKLDLNDGIQAGRNILPRCRIDKTKCDYLIEALRHYQQDYNAKLQIFKGKPIHNWCSNAADAFRYLALSYKNKNRNTRRSIKAKMDYDIYGSQKRKSGNMKNFDPMDTFGL